MRGRKMKNKEGNIVALTTASRQVTKHIVEEHRENLYTRTTAASYFCYVKFVA
jgi:hypothetical protein